MDLHLTDEERIVLANLVDQDFRDLKAEIYKTEDHHYKDELKAREQILEGLLHKLGVPTDIVE